jgi:hypothetical protein
VILDTKGNIFGSFTPVKWESQIWKGDYGNPNNTLKEDDSLKSFLFTLKNPNNFPVKRFALQPKMKHQAINCWAQLGPRFGCGYDIAVSDHCNTNTKSSTSPGPSSISDTGLNGNIVFADSNYRGCNQ